MREDGSPCDDRRSSTRVIAARGRLKKHESGARPADASLIDGECRVIARSALLHASFAVVVVVVVRGVHSVRRGCQQAGNRNGTNGADERAISILAHSHDTRAGQI